MPHVKLEASDSESEVSMPSTPKKQRMTSSELDQVGGNLSHALKFENTLNSAGESNSSQEVIARIKSDVCSRLEIFNSWELAKKCAEEGIYGIKILNVHKALNIPYGWGWISNLEDFYMPWRS